MHHSFCLLLKIFVRPVIKADQESFLDPSEPWLHDNLRKGIFVPDVNFGIYLLNDRYTLGFSAESMLGAAARIGDGVVDTLKAYDRFRMSRHYYAFGSYSFLTGKNLEIEPSVLLKMSEQILPQADMGVTFIYDQSFWLGAAYRTDIRMITLSARSRGLPAGHMS